MTSENMRKKNHYKGCAIKAGGSYHAIKQRSKTAAISCSNAVLLKSP
jgi:hypothetical protein